MIETAPDLETRVEHSLLRVFREAFPTLQVQSYSDAAEASGPGIGIKVESGAENPQGTNIFDVSIEIEARNLAADQRQLMAEMIGNSKTALETLRLYANSKFIFPKGQPVEMMGSPRTVENQTERIVTYELSASIQPI